MVYLIQIPISTDNGIIKIHFNGASDLKSYKSVEDIQSVCIALYSINVS